MGWYLQGSSTFSEEKGRAHGGRSCVRGDWEEGGFDGDVKWIKNKLMGKKRESLAESVGSIPLWPLLQFLTPGPWLPGPSLLP